jgi:hypothetical protein
MHPTVLDFSTLVVIGTISLTTVINITQVYIKVNLYSVKNWLYFKIPTSDFANYTKSGPCTHPTILLRMPLVTGVTL